ncbi:MAG: F-box protein [Nitrososphaerota archaeon]
MLTIVPLDTVRSVFEFLDLKSLIRCRTLCKYIKYIVDYDFVIRKYRSELTLQKYVEELQKMSDEEYEVYKQKKLEEQRVLEEENKQKFAKEDQRRKDRKEKMNMESKAICEKFVQWAPKAQEVFELGSELLKQHDAFLIDNNTKDSPLPKEALHMLNGVVEGADYGSQFGGLITLVKKALK